MKKLALLSALLLSGCGYVSPDAGQEAVLVRKPWFFGSGGIDPTPVHTGSEVVASSTDAVYVSITPTAFEVPLDNALPSNGIPLDFHSVVRMKVVDTPELVRNWNGAAKDEKGNESYYWFWGTIAPVYANMVRQEVRKYTMEQLAFDGQFIDQIDARVTNKLQAFIKANKMPVQLLSVTIGKATPPSNILAQRTETAAQEQRVKTEAAGKLAEDSRRAREASRAAADNAYRTEMQLTPEQYVQLQQIAALKGMCGNRNCTVLLGTGSTPLVNVGK